MIFIFVPDMITFRLAIFIVVVMVILVRTVAKILRFVSVIKLLRHGTTISVDTYAAVYPTCAGRVLAATTATIYDYSTYI
jgi:cation transporter-like permease